MSRQRPAALEGSLLARKGGAKPAIPDESPLILRLEEHRQEQTEEATATPQLENTPPPHPAPPVSPVEDRKTGGSGWLSRLTRRAWLLAAAVAAVVVAAVVLWPSNDAGDTSPDLAAAPSDSEPVGDAESPGLQLNLAAVEETPPSADQLAEPEKPEATVEMPASAALAVTAAPDDEAAAEIVGTETTAPSAPVATPVEKPATGSILPVNVPPNETTAPLGEIEPTPNIPATLPKSVSPVPVPRAKPELGVAPAGRYAVQLASIAEESKATQEAFRLQKQLGEVLGGREIQVEKAVIAGKGTMYRLRASGYRTHAEARGACAQVVRLNSDCLAVRR